MPEIYNNKLSSIDYNLVVNYLNKYVIDWSDYAYQYYEDKRPGYFSGLGFATWEWINAPIQSSYDNDCVYFYLRLYHDKKKALSNLNKVGLIMVNENLRKTELIFKTYNFDNLLTLVKMMNN